MKVMKFSVAVTIKLVEAPLPMPAEAAGPCEACSTVEGIPTRILSAARGHSICLKISYRCRMVPRLAYIPLATKGIQVLEFSRHSLIAQN